MNARTLLEIVQAHEGADPYTLAKAVEQAEREFLTAKATALGFP